MVAVIFSLALLVASTALLNTSYAQAEVVERDDIHDEETGNTTIKETIILEVENEISEESAESFNTESEIIEEARKQFNAISPGNTTINNTKSSVQDDFVELEPFEEIERSGDDVKIQASGILSKLNCTKPAILIMEITLISTLMIIRSIYF